LQLSIDNDVVNHLLFHKALIDEEQDAGRINQYLTMAQHTGDGDHVTMMDVFDRSIALAFELVINNQFDPWGIDLIQFSSLYLKHAKEQKIDLITAGRIIYMAWKVLRMQSDQLVIHMESEQQHAQEFIPFDWDTLPSGAWMEQDDGYSYTNLVMKNPEPPLDEPIRRQAERKVTLMELLSAFDQARKEAEEYQILDERRREERERLAELTRKRMKGTAHEDHLEEDIGLIWKRIQKCGKASLTLNEICPTRDAEERIRTFISVLFLAYDNKIDVYQKSFPHGKIFIKNKGYT
jgi:segregation and condensation protein A